MLYKKITSINFYILTEPLKLSREKWFKIYFYEFVVQKKFNTDTISDARDPIFRWFCCPCSLLLEFSNFDIRCSSSHFVEMKNTLIPKCIGSHLVVLQIISYHLTSIYSIFNIRNIVNINECWCQNWRTLMFTIVKLPAPVL